MDKLIADAKEAIRYLTIDELTDVITEEHSSDMIEDIVLKLTDYKR